MHKNKGINPISTQFIDIILELRLANVELCVNQLRICSFRKPREKLVNWYPGRWENIGWMALKLLLSWSKK